MARIELPGPEEMNDEQRRVYDAIVGGPRGRLVGPLRAALHNPELADRWQKMGALLRFGTTISPILSELAILVTARRWNGQVEWHIHALAAQKAGLPDSVIEAIRMGEPPHFEDEAQAAVYEFSRQLQQHGDLTEESYRSVLEKLKTVGVVELTAIIGYYTMVAMTLNAHRIPLPDEGVEEPLRPTPRPSASSGLGDGLPSLTELPRGSFGGRTGG